MEMRRLIYRSSLFGFILFSSLADQRIQFKDDVTYHCENDMSHDGNVIAHRGFSSFEVENSFNSVKKAVDSNCVDGVEIDVRLTKDEEIVLSHNDRILGVGKISDTTLEELEDKTYKSPSISKLDLVKSCILGRDGELIYSRYIETKDSTEPVTTLEYVLDNITSKKTLLVDMKFSDDDNTVFIEKVDKLFSKYVDNFDIIFQASDYDELCKMKDKYPNYKYQLIIGRERNLKYLDSDFEMFGIRKNLITKDMLEEQTNKGKTISVWTINSYSEYKELEDELGDSINEILIITDYPDEICYLLNNKKQKILE